MSQATRESIKFLKMTVNRENKYGWILILAFGVLLSGCRSTSEWNPFVDLDGYDSLVVADFEDQGNGAGKLLADQVASELMRTGDYREVLREPTEGDSILVEGTIRRYVVGNVAARIKFGKVVGQSSMTVEVRVSVEPGDEFVGSFVVDESTFVSGPNAGRTGREDINWLQKEVARLIAQKIESKN